MHFNFLVLHGLGMYRPARATTINHLKFLERYGPGEHNFLYHRWDEPITSILRRTTFHVVVFSTSALRICRHRPREHYYRIRDAWSYLADLDAVKLAFPQDDYHQTTELDALFDGLGVDIVYSVLPMHMNMFYPSSGRSAILKGVLTGYVDDNSVVPMARFNRPFECREFDIFQRVTMYPYFGGRYGRTKGHMARRFKEVAEKAGLKVDVSTRVEDVLSDDRWLECLGNSRFSLGCEGGVSVWDPDRIYQDLVLEYVRERRDASFEEVEAVCFPSEDYRYVFSAVSPRLFESAMMGCSQILVEGEYLGLLQPWEHYIPVRQDMGNVADAVEEMGDLESAKRRVAACHEILVENPSLRYSALAREVIADIQRLSADRGYRKTDAIEFLQMVADHHAELRSWRTWYACRPAADFENRFRPVG